MERNVKLSALVFCIFRIRVYDSREGNIISKKCILVSVEHHFQVESIVLDLDLNHVLLHQIVALELLIFPLRVLILFPFVVCLFEFPFPLVEKLFTNLNEGLKQLGFLLSVITN